MLGLFIDPTSVITGGLVSCASISRLQVPLGRGLALGRQLSVHQ